MKNRIKRLWIAFLVTSTEIRLHDREAAQRAVTEPRTTIRIALDIEETREELAALRAAYLATFAPGIRRTWKFA